MWNTEVAQEINNENHTKTFSNFLIPWKGYHYSFILFYFIFVFGGEGTFKLIVSKFFKYIFSRNCGEMYIK